MAKVNTKRLLKLVALLEKDAKNKKGAKFDMGTWGQSDTDTPKLTCGTQACAFGLACLSGAFKAEGLRYDIEDPNPWAGEDQYKIVPKFKGKEGFQAAEAFFGLNGAQSECLFGIDYPKLVGAKAELAVADRIRNFVKFSEAISNIKEADRFIEDLNW